MLGSIQKWFWCDHEIIKMLSEVAGVEDMFIINGMSEYQVFKIL